jgi:hypothetical protein
MDKQNNIPIIRRGDFVVIVGGGRWGTKGAVIAKEAGARTVIIDSNQECLSSKIADRILTDKEIRGGKIEETSLVIGDLTDVLVNILKYEHPQWIVPAIPGGTLGKLMEKWLVIKSLKVTENKSLIKNALTLLPKQVVLYTKPDNIITSYMPKGMRCQVPCQQPEMCPVTGYKKPAPMYELLELALTKVVSYFKIFVAQDIGGVGTISGPEVQEWLEYVEGLATPYSLAVGISCRCHANTTLFDVEGNIRLNDT